MWRWCLLWGVCALAGLTVQAQGVFADTRIVSEDAGVEGYNCEVTLYPGAHVTADHGVQLALEWTDARAATLATITLHSVTIAVRREGHSATVKSLPLHLIPGATSQLTLLRRGAWLGVLCNERLVGGVAVSRGPGGRVSLLVGMGWRTDPPNVQPIEPVTFSDDFMRVDAVGWHGQQGKWALRSAWEAETTTHTYSIGDTTGASNPFAYAGHADGTAPAVTTAVAGKDFWDDYIYSVAVQPPADGAVGLLLNLRVVDNGVLVRWSPASESGPRGNRLSLCRWSQGKLIVVAESMGGFIPGQWYKVSVTSSLRDGVQVAVDGVVRLPFTPVTPLRGGIGLYTESRTGAIFDDVNVMGRGVNADLLSEQQTASLNQRFHNDPEMKAWANTQSDWAPLPADPAMHLNRYDFYGDHRVVATVTPTATPGELVLALAGDGASLTSGYRAVIKCPDNTGTVIYQLYRADTLCAPETNGHPCIAGETYSFRLLREGTHLRLQRDGETVVETTDPRPLPGLRPAYRATGCFTNQLDVLASGRNVLDYSFATAPVDWLAEGAWQPSVRWSCAPQWSFLGGWSRGDAVLWQKQRFNGDQTVQAFLGIKMEYPRERAVYEDRYRTLGLTICSDGKDPRQGYALLFGAPDEQGNPNRRTLLLRNGLVVASNWQTMPPKDYGHHTWFALTLRKHGAVIDAEIRYVMKNMWYAWDTPREMVVTLTYTDPQPLDSGVPAIWTSDNGITVARARVFYQSPPLPRREPQIAISEPAYPEWANVGAPLKLIFPALYATDGKPAVLRVEPGQAPKGDEAAVSIRGTTATFTPTQAGEHWYKFCAGDGDNRSPYTHVTLPVFTPTMGRDDSHALILYRFDERQGTVIHDHGIAPAVDLVIPPTAQTHWLPEGGLAYTGPAPLRTTGATKLKALATSGAGTLEFWISPATNDTPTGSNGCLLAWGEKQNGLRNFDFMHNWYTPQLIGPGAHYRFDSQKWEGPYWGGNYWEHLLPPHLVHLVFTWEGKTGALYINSVRRGSNGDLTGLTEKWRIDAPLLVGNIETLQENYLGTFYLLAIHDRALTPEQIQRHYQAGPSAM